MIFSKKSGYFYWPTKKKTAGQLAVFLVYGVILSEAKNRIISYLHCDPSALLSVGLQDDSITLVSFSERFSLRQPLATPAFVPLNVLQQPAVRSFAEALLPQVPVCIFYVR